MTKIADKPKIKLDQKRPKPTKQGTIDYEKLAKDVPAIQRKIFLDSMSKAVKDLASYGLPKEKDSKIMKILRPVGYYSLWSAIPLSLLAKSFNSAITSLLMISLWMLNQDTETKDRKIKELESSQPSD